MDRLKRAKTDVQRKFADLQATSPHSFQNLRREVKPGGRSGNCTGTFGKNSLITFAVRNFIRTLDIRWQRNVTEALEMLADAALVIGSEMQRA
jgi:hypothetical protein